MVRSFVFAVLALGFVAGFALADDPKPAKAAKNQMVKGTIKSVDYQKALLIVDQKVKNETVQRELSITETTEFVFKENGEEKSAIGKEGLIILEGKEGSAVQVKCDKDVNVLRVTVTFKK